MPTPIPIDPRLVDAANTLYAQTSEWAVSDQAITTLHLAVPGFGPAGTLLKVVTLNALYGTQVYALTRVARHFADVLAATDPTRAGPELVARLAAVPQGGSEKRPVRRTSLAAKFAHFFIDPARFPILDQHAARLIARHARVPRAAIESDYPAFAAAFQSVAAASNLTSDPRRLDRYLWVQGQWESWTKAPDTASSALRPHFEAKRWPPTL